MLSVNLKEDYEVKQLIKEAKGRFFSVVFVKKDGSIRKMLCRKGVQNWTDESGIKQTVKGTGKPRPEHLITVWDCHKKNFRCFNINTVLSLRVNGVQYSF